MRRRRAITWAAACAAAAVAPAATAHAEPEWAPAAEATIRPGAEMITGNGQCTANFVFYDATSVYLGYSAHCANVPPDDPGPVHVTAPCGDPSLPLDTAVQIEGATKPGRLAYSSHETMHRVGEKDEYTCASNDFALVRVDPADAGKVNPTVPFWGGPTGLRQGIPSNGEIVISYGNSMLRQGIEQLKPREGAVAAEGNGGWEFLAYFATPGVPGDSGSGVLDAAGSASGVLNGIAIPFAANVMADLSELLAYMRRHTGLTMRLATGTEPFSGPLLGVSTVAPPKPQPDPQPEPEPAPAPNQTHPRGQPPAGAAPAPSGLRLRVVGRQARRGRVLRLRLRSEESLRNLVLELQARGRVVARGRLARLDGTTALRLRGTRRIARGAYALRVRAADGRSALLRLRVR